MTTTDVAATPQPAPSRGGRSITILVVADLVGGGLEAHPSRDQVIRDLVSRDEMGFKKYGQNLETYDGRDTLADAYQESLDLVQYLRKHIEEGNDGEYVRCVYLGALRTVLALRSMIDERATAPITVTNNTDAPRGLEPTWAEVEAGHGGSDE